jgi:hypothetical protein
MVIVLVLTQSALQATLNRFTWRASNATTKPNY